MGDNLWDDAKNHLKDFFFFKVYKIMLITHLWRRLYKMKCFEQDREWNQPVWWQNNMPECSCYYLMGFGLHPWEQSMWYRVLQARIFQMLVLQGESLSVILSEANRRVWQYFHILGQWSGNEILNLTSRWY